MTKKQKYAAGAGAVVAAALLAWWFWPRAGRAAVGRVKKELEIDANVYSPTFGEKILPPGRAAESSEMQRLIDESNAAIALEDADASEGQ